MHRILFLTNDEHLRTQVKPLAQWLELHAPISPLHGLENIKESNPECFILDAAILSPMVIALLSTIRSCPTYRSAPVIVIGDSPLLKHFSCDRQFPRNFNLRRLEEAIAELLQTRLVGRGSHGPHHGSVY